MASRLPDVIPLFPLPNVVHFPRVLLPLHVFEPRYRDLVRDTLAGPRLVGMVLLRPEWEAGYRGSPPIFETGTAGELVRSDELPDGRFNILLHGVREFTIEREVGRRAYREAAVAWRHEGGGLLAPAVRERAVELVGEYVRRRHPEVAGEVSPPADDEVFVNFVSQQLDLPVIERQALLEAVGVAARGERLVEVLEFHVRALQSGAAAPSGLQ